MNRHLKYLFIFIAIIALSAIFEFGYILNKKVDIDAKKASVELLTMPDLAVSTEAHFIRHKSITDLFSIFGLGPSLLPYFPSDFVYSPPNYLNKGAYIEPKTP